MQLAEKQEHIKYSFMKVILSFWLVAVSFVAFAQDVVIEVDASKGQRQVSPYIYGRNNNFSNVFGTPTSAAEIALYKEAGLRFARENTGNNATKYNWRLKISSHPDWYNNVYDHDWDFAAQTIEKNMPDLQAMWAFQLIGKVAGSKRYNFNDWSYNSSQYWSGCSQNLAGGGVVNPNGEKALTNGDPNLYLVDWPADSTTEILMHWFGNDGIGLNPDQFRYWSMDNEPEIWNGTHDDVMPSQISANEFMNRYFEVAKLARAKFPNIKLAGPVPANEWQWYKYANESLKIGGTYYCWLEYFIKRVADEQKASGIRLLDVLDIHWYPSESKDADVLQLHRIFFDETYAYPGANGLKSLTGGWTNNASKEYIFKRINTWLDKHFGEGHGISLALSESGINSSNPNVNSVLYASMLGTFASNGVEIFTPWTWKTGMWETLHLFSRYAKNVSVNTTSSLENMVSGYTTINNGADSMTVILVNRDLTSAKQVQVVVEGFTVSDGTFQALTIDDLPAGETFKSHTTNALKAGQVNVTGNSFTVSLPSLSTTAIILKGKGVSAKRYNKIPSGEGSFIVYPNPANTQASLNFVSDEPLNSVISISNNAGRIVDAFKWEKAGTEPFSFSTVNYQRGVYFVKVSNEKFSTVSKLMICK